MKLRLSLLDCGKCGKPRGRYHVCSGSRKGRDKLRLKAGFTCGTCKRTVSNPFTHTCGVRSDWAKRKRSAERQEKAKATRDRRRARKADAAKRRKAAAAGRRAKAAAEAKARKPRPAPHNPRTCADPGCTKYGCLKYQEGFTDGMASATEGSAV